MQQLNVRSMIHGKTKLLTRNLIMVLVASCPVDCSLAKACKRTYLSIRVLQIKCSTALESVLVHLADLMRTLNSSK